MATENNAIRTNYVKVKIYIYKTLLDSKSWLCGDRDETINYIINECIKTAQKECKKKTQLGGESDLLGISQERK